jgi:hypothetical protein
LRRRGDDYRREAAAVLRQSTGNLSHYDRPHALRDKGK